MHTIKPGSQYDNARTCVVFVALVVLGEVSQDFAYFDSAFVCNFYSNYCPLFCRLTPREFNSYGSRRGNDDVMSRGTFANIRLVNKFMTKAGPKTRHIPSGETMDVFDAATRYKEEGISLIVLAGKDYGSGSSRDWAAKGPWILVHSHTHMLTWSHAHIPRVFVLL